MEAWHFAKNKKYGGLFKPFMMDSYKKR